MYLLHLPAGWVGVSMTSRGIYALTLPAASREEALESLVRSPREVADDDLLQSLVLGLTAYFAGVKVDLKLPVDLEGYSPFQRQVLIVLTGIGYGSTRTYGEVAGAAGSPRAARAVGQVCAANRILLVIPCHRVTAAAGHLGGFAAGLEWKRRLLALEGSGANSDQTIMSTSACTISRS